MRRIARGVMRYVVDAQDPFIVPITHAGGDRMTPVSEPLRTLTTANRGEMMLVTPLVVDTAHGEGMGRGVSEWPADEPLRTLSASPGKAIAAVAMTKFSENAAGFDPREPLNTVMAGGQGHAVLAATMVQTGYGEREGQAPGALDLAEPLGTQVAGGSKAALVAAFLAQHNADSRRIGGVNPGRDAREPMATLTMQSQVGVGAVTLGSLRGTDVHGQDIRDPLPTQSAGGNHEMLIMPFLQTYYGSGDNNHDVRDPLHTMTVGDRHGLVTVEVDGQTMVITDILMRMLDWSEGARAHGFDPDSLRHEIEVVDARGKVKQRPPNKTECGHLIGNSVPPRMVELLAGLNVTPELMAAAE